MCYFVQELPSAGEMRHILLSKRFMALSVGDLQTKYPLVGDMSNGSIRRKQASFKEKSHNYLSSFHNM
jgi:hypothetical protein